MRHLVSALSLAVVIAGCATPPPPPPVVEAPPPPPPPRVIAVSTYGTGNAEVLAVPAPDHSQLKLGKWSFEANKLAVKKGCIGDGAWLITPPAPREAYRVFCDNGRAFTAMCDSFQCLEDK